MRTTANHIEIVSVGEAPPPAIQHDRWPCFLCHRQTWLHDLRRTHVRGGPTDEHVLICLECLDQIATD
jgi:hypothetical protein